MKYWDIEDIHIWDFHYHDPSSFPEGSQVFEEHLAYCRDILSPAYLKIHKYLEHAEEFSSIVTHHDSNNFYAAFDISVHNLIKDLLSHRKGGGHVMCPDCEALYVFDYDATTPIGKDIIIGKLHALSNYERPDIWNVQNERLRYLTNERVRPFECQ
jgi:hypothetical protein